MSNTTAVKDVIKTVLRPAADKLLKAHKKETEDLRALAFKLQPAIEKDDRRLIQLYVKAMEVEVQGIGERLSRTARILEKLQELEGNEAFVDQLPQIEKLTAEMSELERKLNKNYGIGKQLLDEANDALDKPADSGRETKQEWAVMETWLKKNLDFAKQHLKEIGALKVKAQKAAAERDDKALKEILKAAVAIRDDKPDHEELEKSLESFCEECKWDKLPKEMRDQYTRDREAFKKIVEEFRFLKSDIAGIYESIEKLELKPVDYRKAAAALKIPASHEGKFSRILDFEDAPMMKALEALSKELKLGKSAKDMVAILKKGRFI